ncbi:hypothetical protein [Variovorax sp. N23]|uniref:hypothetical protein n=1 Tax=Variovorax sp. N23 TaxID=2980555 RepID=UPI0021C77104|nr:hypothetical protein [Variovorax sp. N23]MCU4121185.1 hypothetical protein [Variovorax sp. N23]
MRRLFSEYAVRKPAAKILRAYHGDPLGGSGVLCYIHFGWDMLEQARAAGFRDAYALAYRAPAFGYLGDASLMFFAVA